MSNSAGKFKKFSTLEYARYYLDIGLSVIPLAPRSKTPIIKWEPFQDRLPTIEEITEWFDREKNRNIAIVCGAVSGNLVVIDFDDESLYNTFRQKLFDAGTDLWNKFLATWVVQTKKGFHIYFRIQIDKEEFKKRFRSKSFTEKHLDIKAEGGYVVAPPSIHKDDPKIRYRFVEGQGPPDNPVPATLTLDEWNRIMEILGIDPKELSATPEQPVQEPGDGQKASPDTECKKLGDKEIMRIEELLEPYYVEGHRDYIIMYTLGAFIKANICRDDARKVVEILTGRTKDPEQKDRLYLVNYHYDKRINSPGVGKLKGLSGLREELENVMKERGESDDIIAQKASEIIAEISSILGVKRESGGVAWLERDDDGISKWVAVGKQGIYVYRRSQKGKVIKIVSNAKIGEVKVIKVIGLDFKDFYAVGLEGEKVIGTVDEILDIIEKRYGIEAGYQYAIARLIDYMAEDEEELYYSPGPWVVDNKIIFAKEPGYTPPWKRYVRWEIRTDDPGEEAVRKALMAIRNLVLAYRNPAKASAVLSYAVVSPIAYYVKNVLNIFPHMLIHGLEGTGKSVLLDFIKLLFNISWEEELPGSDYQARRLLTTSTLPAVVDELGAIIEGYRSGKKSAQDVVEILHRSATQETLRISGGHEYGGYFLAIRSIIGATNADISLLPWQMDKFIIIRISYQEAIDIDKARGFTPRTMDPNTKLAIQYVGYLLLKGLEAKLSEIEKLKALPRDELKKRLLEIGYTVWADIYKRYGLEPFPPPAEGENEITSVSVKEEYRDLFISYVHKCLSRFRNDLPPITVVGEGIDIEEDENVLKDLETYGAIIDKKTKEIIMKTTFLKGFMQWAVKEYGVPYLGWQRLAELLGMGYTRRKIGGRIVNNLLVFELDHI